RRSTARVAAELIAQAAAHFVVVDAAVEAGTGTRDVPLEHAAALDVAVAVAGVENEVVGQAVGRAGHQGVGETPVGRARIALGRIGVVDLVPLHLRTADTGADIGRDAV